MSNKYWTFVSSKNNQEKIVVHDLDSAKTLANTLKAQKQNPWLVKEAGKTMLSCADFLELLDSPENFGLADDKTVIAFQTKVVQANNELRNQDRINLNFKVTLSKGKNVFNSYTENISAGGLLIKNKVPEEFLLNECKVIIDSGDNLVQIEFTAKVLSANSGGTRIKFEGEAAEDSIENLMQYIAKYHNNPNRKKIKIGRN